MSSGESSQKMHWQTKKGPFSQHFKAEMRGRKKKKKILFVTDALSATANVTFPWASNIHRLNGPAPLRTAARFLFLGQLERADKMDAGVTALAGVTDGLIIQTHPSGHRKTQHLAC